MSDKIQTIDPNWVNVSARAEVITPAIAADWLSRNINNRPLTKNQVRYYAKLICEGKWKINGEAICLDKNNNLINGQHRLSAVIESGMPIASMVVRGIDPEAFTTFDSGRNRSLTDVFSLKGINNAANVSSVVNKCYALKISGFTITSDFSLTTRSDAKRKSKQDMLDLYFSNPDLFQDMANFSKNCVKRLHILQASSLGAIASFLVMEKHHSIEKVCGFFVSLTTESDFDNSMIAALRSKLIKNNMIGTTTKLSPTYIQQLIIKVWNAYVEGRVLKVLKWDESIEGKLQFK